MPAVRTVSSACSASTAALHRTLTGDLGKGLAVEDALELLCEQHGMRASEVFARRAAHIHRGQYRLIIRF